MKSESLLNTTHNSILVKRTEMSVEVLNYIGGCLSDGGKVGETGWHVSVSKAEGSWRFDLSRHGTPMLRAFLAGTEGAAVTLWQQACREAAARSQLHRGSDRRMLKAPWIATIVLDGLELASHQLHAEAEGLKAYVAFALIEGDAI
ncbi:hypothetical protein [Rhizobium sp. TRM95796]|uniref:hypothetical protein n=1 Tax=Rhizobium sp. TRM95796 TaxID=2979862 RepID=UPI0021E97934|nr:hypothetical protein [Rhizobium sp. TRM95796]MCV3769088.1 hypothetical protein [Rhizobium sp. TRM95796]